MSGEPRMSVCVRLTLPVTLSLWLQNEIKLSSWPEAMEKQVLCMLIIPHSLVCHDFSSHTHKHTSPQVSVTIQEMILLSLHLGPLFIQCLSNLI